MTKEQAREIIAELIREEYTPESPAGEGPTRARALAKKIMVVAEALDR